MKQAPAAPSTRAHILVGAGLVAATVVTLLLGRLAVSIFLALVLVAAYYDLRRLLAERGHPSTFVLGGIGVAAFLWTGYEGDLALLPGIAAALVLALLVTRIAANEAGYHRGGVTGDLAATIGASAVVGILGAHVLLIRAVPRSGSRGLIAFGLMLIASDVAAFFVGRWRGRRSLNKHIAPQKTWEGALAGFIASAVVGLIIGITMDPPFDPTSGPLFGIAVGLLAPLGDLAFSAIKRSAGERHSGTYFGAAGGVLDAVDGLLFSAPAFYWAFRTIAL